MQASKTNGKGKRVERKSKITAMEIAFGQHFLWSALYLGFRRQWPWRSVTTPGQLPSVDKESRDLHCWSLPLLLCTRGGAAAVAGYQWLNRGKRRVQTKSLTLALSGCLANIALLHINPFLAALHSPRLFRKCCSPIITTILTPWPSSHAEMEPGTALQS